MQSIEIYMYRTYVTKHPGPGVISQDVSYWCVTHDDYQYVGHRKEYRTNIYADNVALSDTYSSPCAPL